MSQLTLNVAWSECLESEKRGIVQNCGDHLDFLNDQQRLSAAKRLVYISLGTLTAKAIYAAALMPHVGCYGEYSGLEKKQAHLQAIEQNNQMLFKMDILASVKQCLHHACKQLEM